ncbi:MAG TPA: aminotransferase class V-fold PLP-dependent enzyme [Vicinamibacteria bacterium]|nr:aminotransferase class V-fold PLP-dependent enzyme [Vicinamibacteria bacterium]
MEFPLDYVRGCFPALQDSSTVFLDNVSAPKFLGTVRALRQAVSLEDDPAEIDSETRESLAFFLNSNIGWADEEIVFSPDVALLAERLSTALADEYPPGSAVVVTEIDDDWHLAPWRALARRGIEARSWPLRQLERGLDENRLDGFLTENTRAVIVPKASTALGTVMELLPVALRVREHGSALVVNWTPFLSHGAIDVRFLRADFVLASARPLFGARVGFLWGRKERLRELRSRRRDPFGGIDVDPKDVASLGAALRYVEELGLLSHDLTIQPSEDYGRRRHMRRGMQAIRHYERSLTTLALRRLAAIPGTRVFGIDDADSAARRTPHLYFRLGEWKPAELAAALGEERIRVDHGDCGCRDAVKALGLPEHEGAVSASLAHYNTESDVERFAEALNKIARA